MQIIQRITFGIFATSQPIAICRRRLGPNRKVRFGFHTRHSRSVRGRRFVHTNGDLKVHRRNQTRRRTSTTFFPSTSVQELLIAVLWVLQNLTFRGCVRRMRQILRYDMIWYRWRTLVAFVTRSRKCNVRVGVNCAIKESRLRLSRA